MISILGRYAIICIILLLSLNTYCQKVVNAQGEFTLRIESNMSEDEAIEKARNYARINAIENAFGKVIIQGNATLIKNVVTGNQVETNSSLSFIADSYVNGEWLETINEKREIINQPDQSRWIKIIVYGKIRELNNQVYSCEAFTLSCPSIECKTDAFNNRQKLYMYFKSSEKGFLSIYLDDPYQKLTSRILPYSHTEPDDVVNFPVMADKAYYLFSPEHDYLNNTANIDELELIASEPVEQYKIYVFFSRNEFTKPLLNNSTKERLPEQYLVDGYSLPPGLPSEKFQHWQLHLRSRNPEIEMQTIIITVSN